MNHICIHSLSSTIFHFNVLGRKPEVDQFRHWFLVGDWAHSADYTHGSHPTAKRNDGVLQVRFNGLRGWNPLLVFTAEFPTLTFDGAMSENNVIDFHCEKGVMTLTPEDDAFSQDDDEMLVGRHGRYTKAI